MDPHDEAVIATGDALRPFCTALPEQTLGLAMPAGTAAADRAEDDVGSPAAAGAPLLA